MTQNRGHLYVLFAHLVKLTFRLQTFVRQWSTNDVIQKRHRARGWVFVLRWTNHFMRLN